MKHFLLAAAAFLAGCAAGAGLAAARAARASPQEPPSPALLDEAKAFQKAMDDLMGYSVEDAYGGGRNE